MSQLRDARLHKALQSAPDGDARPGEAVRQAILAAAHAAVAPVPPAPWWKRIRPQRGQGAMPWNTAFATVLLAGVITALWRHEEVPQAQTEADRAIPAASPAPVASTPAPVPAPVAAPAQGGAAAKPRAAAPPQAQRKADARKDVEAPVAAQSRAEVQPAPQPAPAAVPPAPVPAAATPATPAAPAPALVAEAATAASLAKSQAPAAVAEGRVAAAAPAARDRTAGASNAFQVQARPAWSGWTQMRIEQGGRAAVVTPPQAPRAVQLMNQLGGTASVGDASAPAGPDWRLTLERDGRAMGVLELREGHLRWLPDQAAPAALFGGPGTLRALQDELQRLLPP